MSDILLSGMFFGDTVYMYVYISGTRWIGRNKPSTTRWLARRRSCTCKCTRAGAPATTTPRTPRRRSRWNRLHWRHRLVEIIWRFRSNRRRLITRRRHCHHHHHQRYHCHCHYSIIGLSLRTITICRISTATTPTLVSRLRCFSVRIIINSNNCS